MSYVCHEKSDANQNPNVFEQKAKTGWWYFVKTSKKQTPQELPWNVQRRETHKHTDRQKVSLFRQERHEEQYRPDPNNGYVWMTDFMIVLYKIVK